MEREELLKMKEKIDQELLLDIKKGIEEADEDTTPYAGVVDGEIIVQGDPNNTEVKAQDYTAKFLFPKSFASKFEGAKEVGHGYIVVDIEYKDVFPSAKKNMKFTSAMAQLIPFFKKLQEDGSVEEMTEEEAIEFFASINDEVIDSLYRLVQVVLDVNKDYIDYMTPSSALEIAGRIIRDFPSVVSQSDLFFDLSTEKA